MKFLDLISSKIIAPTARIDATVVITAGRIFFHPSTNNTKMEPIPSERSNKETKVTQCRFS